MCVRLRESRILRISKVRLENRSTKTSKRCGCPLSASSLKTVNILVSTLSPQGGNKFLCGDCRFTNVMKSASFALLIACAVSLVFTVHAQTSAVPPECLDTTRPVPPQVFCPINTPGTSGVSGVISQTTTRSCRQYSQQLDCGVNGNVTLLTLGLNPGTGLSTSYRFRVLTQATLGDRVLDPDGVKCTGSGETLSCAVMRDLTLVVNVSRLIVGYSLNKRIESIPFAYTPFHSNNYESSSNIKNQCSDGENLTEEYGGTSNKKNDIRKDGIAFQEPCNFMKTSKTDSGRGNREFECLTWPNAYQCGSNADDRTYGGGIGKGGSRQRGVQCGMPMPNPEAENFGMIRRGDKPLYFFPYLTSPPPQYQADDDDDDDNADQCLKKFSRLKDNSVCRMWYGTYWYLGYDDNSRIGYDTNPNSKLPSSTPVRPVIVGCGPQLKYGGLFPRNDKFKGDYNNPVSKHDLEDGNRIKNPFTADDDDDSICMGSIQMPEAKKSSGTTIQCKPSIAEIPFLGTASPACSLDRIGEISHAGYGAIGAAIGTTAHKTADYMGRLGPYCTAYEISSAPKPIFSATATLYNSDGEVVDSVEISNSGQCDGGSDSITPIIGQARVSQSVMLTIDNIDTTTGRIADNVGGYFVVCNQSYTEPAGRSPQMFMGEGQCGRENPWEKIANSWNADHPINGKKVTGGFVPLPQYLRYTNKAPNPNGMWFYYVPVRKMSHYGTGCNQLGMDQRWFLDPRNAARMCASPRYECTPGFKKGGYPGKNDINHDWTLEDRMTDIIMGTNVEYGLRDELDRHTPCVVSGYFQQWNDINNCLDFISAYLKQGYLPPGWVDEAALGKAQCTLPKWWLHGANALYDLSSSNNIYLRMTAAIAGTAINVQTSISSGRFVRQKLADVQCGVVRNGDGGAIVLYVENTGDLVGDYLVRGTCTGGIRVLTAPVLTIAPRQSATATVRLSQSGAVVNGTSCTFDLTHPVQTYMIFDEVSNLPCTVEYATGGAPPPDYADIDPCVAFQTCVVKDTKTTKSNAVAFGMGFWLFIWLLFSGAMAGIAYYGFTSGKKAKLIKADAQRRSEVNRKKIRETDRVLKQ